MSERDDRSGPRDVPFTQPGTGVPVTYLCMGCNLPRQRSGSRGVGVRMRCAVCVEAKNKARAS